MLYIVATPIGNLSEMSGRAIEVLKSVDLIAAEDTRHSSKLLKHFGIETKTVVYQKFNERESAKGLVDLMLSGKSVALISDAGMPLISDPGSVLVDRCIENGLQIVVVSGACAAINAVVLSGFSLESFSFLGFLPDKESARKDKISSYLFSPSALIFYCPPQNVDKDLNFLFNCLGKRSVVIARELTKKFESVYRGKLGEDFSKINKSGEFVIVVEGYKGEKEKRSILEIYQEYLSLGLSKMEAMKAAAKDLGISKSEVYSALNKS